MESLLLGISILLIGYALQDTEMFARYKRVIKIIYKKNCEVIDVIKNSNEFYYSGDKYPIFDAFKSLKVVKKGDTLYYTYIKKPLFGKSYKKYFKVNIQDKLRQEISYEEFIDSVADDVIIKYVKCTDCEIEDNEDCRSMKSWEGKDNKDNGFSIFKFLGYILLIIFILFILFILLLMAQ